MDKLKPTKVILVSRCAWTLFNFRAGLIRALKKRGDVVLGGGAGGDGFEGKLKHLGIAFVPLPVSLRPIDPWSDWLLLWTLFRWYRRERPDVVHHFTIRPVVYGSVAAWLAGVPKIVNSIEGLGTVFGDGQKRWLRAVVELQYRLAMSLSHLTFFLNRDDYDHFIARGLIKPEKAIVVSGPGVNCEVFKPHSAVETSPNGSVTFLLSARLLWEKGVYDFVQAARLVKQTFPTTQFQLLGMRDERNPNVVPQEVLDQWEAENIITWLGEVSDVRPIVAKADVVVLPTYYREGMPRALLEASAMGKPIIATDTVGCRDVVEQEKSGILVPVKNPQALASAMIRMIESPGLRSSMGKAGRERVVKKFNEQLVIDDILECYD
ncbi:MAG: glycosyltransferase family 4 protein [Nitrospirota bacterium]|nr:MAG: glycosyltransferase family 4 protein [Nitrospirota bacterium]